MMHPGVLHGEPCKERRLVKMGKFYVMKGNSYLGMNKNGKYQLNPKKEKILSFHSGTEAEQAMKKAKRQGHQMKGWGIFHDTGSQLVPVTDPLAKTKEKMPTPPTPQVITDGKRYLGRKADGSYVLDAESLEEVVFLPSKAEAQKLYKELTGKGINLNGFSKQEYNMADVKEKFRQKGMKKSFSLETEDGDGIAKTKSITACSQAGANADSGFCVTKGGACLAMKHGRYVICPGGKDAIRFETEEDAMEAITKAKKQGWKMIDWTVSPYCMPSNKPIACVLTDGWRYVGRRYVREEDDWEYTQDAESFDELAIFSSRAAAKKKHQELEGAGMNLEGFQAEAYDGNAIRHAFTLMEKRNRDLADIIEKEDEDECKKDESLKALEQSGLSENETHVQEQEPSPATRIPAMSAEDGSALPVWDAAGDADNSDGSGNNTAKRLGRLEELEPEALEELDESCQEADVQSEGTDTALEDICKSPVSTDKAEAVGFYVMKGSSFLGMKDGVYVLAPKKEYISRFDTLQDAKDALEGAKIQGLNMDGWLPCPHSMPTNPSVKCVLTDGKRYIGMDDDGEYTLDARNLNQVLVFPSKASAKHKKDKLKEMGMNLKGFSRKEYNREAMEKEFEGRKAAMDAKANDTAMQGAVIAELKELMEELKELRQSGSANEVRNPGAGKENGITEKAEKKEKKAQAVICNRKVADDVDRMLSSFQNQMKRKGTSLTKDLREVDRELVDIYHLVEFSDFSKGAIDDYINAYIAVLMLQRKLRERRCLKDSIEKLEGLGAVRGSMQEAVHSFQKMEGRCYVPRTAIRMFQEMKNNGFSFKSEADAIQTGRLNDKVCCPLKKQGKRRKKAGRITRRVFQR